MIKFTAPKVDGGAVKQAAVQTKDATVAAWEKAAKSGFGQGVGRAGQSMRGTILGGAGRVADSAKWMSRTASNNPLKTLGALGVVGGAGYMAFQSMNNKATQGIPQGTYGVNSAGVGGGGSPAFDPFAGLGVSGTGTGFDPAAGLDMPSTRFDPTASLPKGVVYQ